MSWKPYDPTWLVELAQAQLPEEIWLTNALFQCTLCIQSSRAYLYFIDPTTLVEANSPLQFERNIQLHDKRADDIVLDVYTGNRIGGVEFLKRI